MIYFNFMHVISITPTDQCCNALTCLRSYSITDNIPVYMYSIMHSAFHFNALQDFKVMLSLFEPPHGKTNNLQRRKQSRRSASQ